MDNQTIAQKLREYAAQLAREGESLYRVRAYRQAVLTVQSLTRPLTELVAEEGRAGLEALPGIGRSLAYTIEGLVRTGEFRTRRERRCA
jgi:DNA polymerase/3'-5' exonuclease PolX